MIRYEVLYICIYSFLNKVINILTCLDVNRVLEEMKGRCQDTLCHLSHLECTDLLIIISFSRGFYKAYDCA